METAEKREENMQRERNGVPAGNFSSLALGSLLGSVTSGGFLTSPTAMEGVSPRPTSQIFLLSRLSVSGMRFSGPVEVHSPLVSRTWPACNICPACFRSFSNTNME